MSSRPASRSLPGKGIASSASPRSRRSTFLDNGVIAEKPYGEHSDDEKEVLAQVTRVPKA
jgi:hypothetical protein